MVLGLRSPLSAPKSTEGTSATFEISRSLRFLLANSSDKSLTACFFHTYWCVDKVSWNRRTLRRILRFEWSPQAHKMSENYSPYQITIIRLRTSMTSPRTIFNCRMPPTVGCQACTAFTRRVESVTFSMPLTVPFETHPQGSLTEEYLLKCRRNFGKLVSGCIESCHHRFYIVPVQDP